MIRPVLVPREKPLPGGYLAMSVVSVIAAFLTAALVLYAAGVPPFKAFYEMWMGTFSDWYGLSEVLVKMTPLLLCGLAVTFAFVMNIWNIGAEGQLYAGAITATFVALNFPDLSGWVLIPMMTVAGMIGGMLWAFGPAILKVKFQVNEIITTLMLNYVAIFLLDYFVYGPWKDPVSYGFPITPMFSDGASLPVLGNTRVHLGLAYGLLLACVAYVLLGKTKLGFSMRVIGANQAAAKVNGMPVGKVMIISLCLSGAVAGLAGMCEVAGIQHRLQPNISANYGYTAIIIAWLARLNPWGTIMVAFLFGGLLVGGEVLQISMKIPAHLTMVIQGLILFFVLTGDFFGRFQIRWLKEGEQ